ncbi:hypothetical protein BDI4_580065 [Burkholderia diffusa]|nr:hypothetical protein BDI4_580065 [Burkholderia diffusa]
MCRDTIIELPLKRFGCAAVRALRHVERPLHPFE